jgi:hypothetical protein
MHTSYLQVSHPFLFAYVGDTRFEISVFFEFSTYSQVKYCGGFSQKVSSCKTYMDNIACIETLYCAYFIFGPCSSKVDVFSISVDV